MAKRRFSFDDVGPGGLLHRLPEPSVDGQRRSPATNLTTHNPPPGSRRRDDPSGLQSVIILPALDKAGVEAVAVIGLVAGASERIIPSLIGNVESQASAKMKSAS